MFYNSYAKRAKEQFANKVTVVTCPEDVELASYNLVFAIPVFLAGGITNCEEWQKTVINYFKENWKHERGIIFLNPRRDSFDVTNPNATREQIEWEFKYLNTPHVLFSMYFSNSPSPQPICFYEMGRALGKVFEIDDFDESRKNDVFVATHKDFHRKADVLIQGELADYGSIPSEVDSAEHYAQLLMNYIENNYDLSIPMESSLGRNCFLCKHFSKFPSHGSTVMGECRKKENMVWCSPTRYDGRRKEYKIVSDDDVCKFFEKEKEEEIEKFCWFCENYQPRTLNHGHCKLDESKTVRYSMNICDKNN